MFSIKISIVYSNEKSKKIRPRSKLIVSNFHILKNNNKRKLTNDRGSSSPPKSASPD